MFIRQYKTLIILLLMLLSIISCNDTRAPDIIVTDSVVPADDLQLPFGEVIEGESSDKMATITNEGSANLEISTLAFENPLETPFSITVDDCSNQVLSPSSSCQITIRFAPTTLGTFNDSFNISSNDLNEGSITFNVSGTGIVAFRVYGLDFSPYIDGQDPNLGSQVDEQQLITRMEIIEPYTQWIRTFGSSNGLERSGAIAHSLGLQAALGAWISNDLAANEREIENLIAAAKSGEADILVVGSEVLLRGELFEADVIDYINRVKQEVPELPVSYADVYGVLLSHPNIIDAVDVVLVNYYPYWEGISIDLAVAAIHGWHTQMMAAANGKQVIVSETGWPSNGNQVGNAIPSSDNASLYFLNFVSWSRANDVNYFYFEAFDESWKAAYEGPQGAHWGIWDKDGTLKPGMERVLNGETMEDNWSGGTIPGGPGDPAIEFTHVPPFGSFENMEGQVWHIDPTDYKVAVYIYVSGWWTKPTWANPLTTIQIDGSWITDITTGGVDETATRIAAFLVPNGYNPPSMSGGGTLPAELDQNAVAKVEVTRSS